MAKKAISVTIDEDLISTLKEDVVDKNSTLSAQVEECIRAFYTPNEDDFKTLLKKLNAEHNRVVRMYNTLKESTEE